jgi:hypothetical protein
MQVRTQAPYDSALSSAAARHLMQSSLEPLRRHCLTLVSASVEVGSVKLDTDWMINLVVHGMDIPAAMHWLSKPGVYGEIVSVRSSNAASPLPLVSILIDRLHRHAGSCGGSEEIDAMFGDLRQKVYAAHW